jgi:hypothetical protein
MQSIATFLPTQHFVFDADIGKGASHHHLMVATAGSIRVKVFCITPLLLQISSGRTIFFDIACRGKWSVVTESPNTARIRACLIC